MERVDGRCTRIVGRDCPANTFGRVGIAECQPIGPGPCAAPLADAGDWRCTAQGIAPPDAGWSACAAFDPSVPGFGCLDLTEPTHDCDAPFPPAGATLVQDLSAALQPGAVLAIEGTHAGVTIDVDVTIVGPCASRATIEGIQTNADVEVRGVRLSRTARADGGRLVLRDVHIDGASGLGVYVTGGEVELHDSIVANTQSLGDGSFGRGASVVGGSLLVERSVFEGNREVGAFVGMPGSSLTIRDSIVRDTRAAAGTGSGLGVVAMDDANLTIERSSLLRNRVHGALIFRGGTATFRDVVSASNSGGQASAGVRVEQGGQLDAVNLALVDNVATGLLVDDADAFANVRQVSIGAVHPDAASGFAGGLVSAGGNIDASGVRIDGVNLGAHAALDGRLSLARSHVRGTSGTIGVYARTATITVTDSLIENHEEGGLVADGGGFLNVATTRVIGGPVATDRPSAGVSATEGASIRLEEVYVEDVQGFGVLARGDGSSVTIDGALIDRVRANGPTVGIGVAVSEGAGFAATDLRVQDAQGLGVIVSGGGARLERVVVIGTTPQTGVDGAGILTEGDVVLDSVAVVGNQLAGTFFGRGHVRASNLLVADTQPADGDGFGHGLIALSCGLELNGFEVRGSAFAGLVFATSGALVRDGIVRANNIGVHAQGGSNLVEGTPPAEVPELDVVFDADTLFIDNVTRIGSGEVPLPSPFVLPEN